MAHFIIKNSYQSTSKYGGNGQLSPRLGRFELVNVERSPRIIRKTHNDNMWLNFKDKELQKPVSQGINRQNSAQSSTRSNKSSTSLLKKKIEEHAFQSNTAEWQKEQDYKIIRERRKKIRQQTRKKLKRVRRMYIPAILGMIVGTIILFGSTIQSLGEGSVLYTYSDQFKYVGIIVIILGTVLLLTAVGMEGKVSDNMKKEGIIEIKPIIHPDFLFEEDRMYEKKKLNFEKKCAAISSRQKCDEEVVWRMRNNEDNEEGFLCSSISSATSQTPLHVNDITSRWARAMTMNFDNVDSEPRSPRYSENYVRKYSLPVFDSSNTPFIQISSVSDVPNVQMTSETSKFLLSSAAMTENSTDEVSRKDPSLAEQRANNSLDVPSAFKPNISSNEILEESNC